MNSKHHLLINGQKIAYYKNAASFEKAPLVLLHGFCEDASVLEPVLPFLAPSIPVLCIDLPGFGNSEAPMSPGIDVYADAVCAVLNDLGIEKVVLAGHSMGGYTALEFTAKFPERLLGMGLIHAHPYPDSIEQQENRKRAISMLLEGKRDLYVAQLFPGLFSAAFNESKPEIVQQLVQRGRLQSPEGIIKALEGMMARADHTATLDTCPCPVLLLLGTEDALIPPARQQDMLARPAIADLHVLPGIAHMSMFEASEACAKILENFYQFCLR